MSLSKSSKYIIVLPCYGAPFIWKGKIYNTREKGGKVEMSNELKKVCRGNLRELPTCNVRVHPMFKNRWSIAGMLLKEKDAKLYGHSSGMEECQANMALLVPEFRQTLYGDIALVVPQCILKKYVDPSAMKLVRIEDYYKEMDTTHSRDTDFEPSDEEDYCRSLDGYVFEPYDKEDMNKYKAFVKSKGWFIGTFGHTYEAPTGRADEEEDKNYDTDSDDDEDDKSSVSSDSSDSSSSDEE